MNRYARFSAEIEQNDTESTKKARRDGRGSPTVSRVDPAAGSVLMPTELPSKFSKSRRVANESRALGLHSVDFRVREFSAWGFYGTGAVFAFLGLILLLT